MGQIHFYIYLYMYVIFVICNIVMDWICCVMSYNDNYNLKNKEKTLQLWADVCEKDYQQLLETIVPI